MLHSCQKSGRGCEAPSIGRLRKRLMFDYLEGGTSEVEAVAVRRPYSRNRHSALQG